MILLSLAVLLAVALGWAKWSGGPRARAERAYRRGDWSTAASESRKWLRREPAATEARLTLARSEARLGRDAASREEYRALGAGRLEAADVALIGRGLVREGRTTLGWAALEAAQRIDPREPLSRESLARLHERIGELGDVAKGVDRLGAILRGPALAELVLGLSTASTQIDEKKDAMLDRVVSRPRDQLAAVATPADALKLLARVLLESGRAAEARGLLDSLLKGGPDAEASWLLSRVHLQIGDVDRAADALDRAGRYAADHHDEPEPGLFAGAKRCATCHRTIARVQQGGRHARTIHHGKELAALPIPEGTIADPADPRAVHHFERAGDVVRVETTAEGRVARALVDYAMGSGNHGFTWVGKDEQGHRRELRVSYYAGGKKWDITSGFDPHPRDPDKFLGTVLSRASVRDCIHCHTTRFRDIPGSAGPEAADRGIGCERCHGPGANHVQAVEAGFPETAIAQTKRATPRQRLAVCAECHSADGSIPPTDARFVRFQATTLPYSRCFTQSDGRLDCVTCHDPHRNAEKNPAHYEAKCLECHAPSGQAPGVLSCPVNPRTDCIGCHMPVAEEVLPFTSFTDHHIRVRRESTAKPPGQTKAHKPG